MKSKKDVVFIGPLNINGFVKGGDQAKNRISVNEIEPTRVIDTFNWEKRPRLWLEISMLIISLYLKKRIIFISTSPNSGLKLLKLIAFFGRLRTKIIFQLIGNLTPKILINKNLILLSKISYVIVETESMKNRLLKDGLENVIRMRNYKKFSKIRLFERSKFLEKTNYKILFLSRISKEKGVELLFELVDKFNVGHLQIDFIGPIEENYSNNFLENVSRFPNVRYKGLIDLSNTNEYDNEIDKISSEYDLFLFPTLWDKEGNPGVFIDAFCSGLPIICSNWMDLNEFIEHGKNGFLIEPNTVEEIYNTLDKLYNDLGLMKSLRKNAIESALDYHIENNLNPFLENYC